MDYFWNQQVFLDNYWQTQPWHGEKVLDTDAVNIAPEDLDYLCKQEDVTSRLILDHEKSFTLEKAAWDMSSTKKRTLFIQEMDRWFPEVRAMLDKFPMFPRWRMDDMMGSYSSKGSSSSPHVDFYDVFIIQVAGSKTWNIEKEKRNFLQCKGDALVHHNDLRIIKDFRSFDTYVLHPGDVLYVPTRFVHEAIAEEDSFSYSLGLRSPRIKDMVTHIDAKLGQNIDEDLRMEERHTYKDPYLIPNDIFDHMTNWPTSVPVPKGPTPIWFGELVTTPDDQSLKLAHLSDILLEDQEALIIELDQINKQWLFDPACKIAWQQNHADHDDLFIQGEHLIMPLGARPFLKKLSSFCPISSNVLKEFFLQDPWNQQLWTYLCINAWMWSEDI